MSRRVLKWTVSVDDREHPVGGGPVVLVGCQDDPSHVQVWTEEKTNDGHGRALDYAVRAAVVVGTGQRVPEGWEHVGSVVTERGGLVWHVYRQPAPIPDREEPISSGGIKGAIDV